MSFLFLVSIFISFHSVVGFGAITPPVVVLITGCSTGIGKSTAEEFSKEPTFKVWATMRDTTKSTLATDRSNLKIGVMDVTSDESVTKLISQIIEEDGKIDIVVNNAGYGIVGALETVKIEEAERVFDVNVWGPVRVLQAVLPYMRKQRSGYVINLSSTSGIRGIPCFEFYTGSKFALEGIMDSMRYSLYAYNISVTNVNAGPVKTPFIDRFGHSAVGGRGTRQLPPEGNSDYLQVFTDRMVAGLNYRMNTPEAQTAEDLGRIIVNLAHLKLGSTRMTDVPFNIGSSYDSQSLLEAVRKHPTGWGGVYSDIAKILPPLPEETSSSEKKEEL